MISKGQALKYCRDDISLIENYEKAISDETQKWDCHHRRESIYTKSQLIEIREYYNRPAAELIFLLPKDHMLTPPCRKDRRLETSRKNELRKKARNF